MNELEPSGAELTPARILEQLKILPEKAEWAAYEAALLAAARHRDALTPELIAEIERVTADPERHLEDQNDWLVSFAIYLLAQFRERRALDVFLRFFSLPGEQSLDLTGDMVTEDGASVLASVCGGDPAPLVKLALDEAVNQFVRSQAIQGLLVQSAWGESSREAVTEDLRKLFSALAKPGEAFVWAELAGAVCDFNAMELLPEVRRAFDENLIDESIIDLGEFDPAAERRPGRFPKLSPEERWAWFCERNEPINAADICARWLCFRHDDEDDYESVEDVDEDIDAPSASAPYLSSPVPYVAPPKPGRNEPCPCGSGKKYKKCCGK